MTTSIELHKLYTKLSECSSEPALLDHKSKSDDLDDYNWPSSPYKNGNIKEVWRHISLFTIYISKERNRMMDEIFVSKLSEGYIEGWLIPRPGTKKSFSIDGYKRVFMKIQNCYSIDHVNNSNRGLWLQSNDIWYKPELPSPAFEHIAKPGFQIIANYFSIFDMISTLSHEDVSGVTKRFKDVVSSICKQDNMLEFVKENKEFIKDHFHSNFGEGISHHFFEIMKRFQSKSILSSNRLLQDEESTLKTSTSNTKQNESKRVEISSAVKTGSGSSFSSSSKDVARLISCKAKDTKFLSSNNEVMDCNYLIDNDSNRNIDNNDSYNSDDDDPELILTTKITKIKPLELGKVKPNSETNNLETNNLETNNSKLNSPIKSKITSLVEKDREKERDNSLKHSLELMTQRLLDSSQKSNQQETKNISTMTTESKPSQIKKRQPLYEDDEDGQPFKKITKDPVLGNIQGLGRDVQGPKDPKSRVQESNRRFHINQSLKKASSFIPGQFSADNILPKQILSVGTVGSVSSKTSISNTLSNGTQSLVTNPLPTIPLSEVLDELEEPVISPLEGMESHRSDIYPKKSPLTKEQINTAIHDANLSWKNQMIEEEKRKVTKLTELVKPTRRTKFNESIRYKYYNPHDPVTKIMEEC